MKVLLIGQNWLRKQIHKKRFWILLVLAIWYVFCLPKSLFKQPHSTVVFDAQGTLLGAKIATDGQWRFPQLDSLPQKYKTAVLQFEDAYFYQHPGVNPVSIVKALATNIQAGRVLRGGSTITQQVIRLSRQQPRRTYAEKILEMILASRLELRFSKEDILKLYASHAPFGGNVVGLDMAAWRYFGRSPFELSWAECATLAVLPNAPSLIFPGKNQKHLLNKRNRLLQKLYQEGYLDQLDYTLAIAEELPQKPYKIPRRSPHLVEKLYIQNPGKKHYTHIHGPLQDQLAEIAKKNYKQLSQNQIHNLAILVIDVKTRAVEAYIGNAPTDSIHQKDVNMIHALRSTGSILKPFLYSALLDAGTILPKTLVADVPTIIAGYSPENFNQQFSGAISADIALARSLNIPAVRLLQTFGLQKFRDQLAQLQLRGINKSADHYGLPLILGGAESNLWDICKVYANMAGTLNQFNDSSSTYLPNQLQQPRILKTTKPNWGKAQHSKVLWDAASIYSSFEAMKNATRPEADSHWEYFSSSKTIAWKTGTSFGNKDAWCIGVTPEKVIGVWVGNADGEGRPEMTGVRSAAPILFETLDLLPKNNWFTVPYDAMIETQVCAESGYLAGPNCISKNTWIPQAGVHSSVCPYHPIIHTNLEGNKRVNSSCSTTANRKSVSWFVLPPLMAYYYQKNHPTYKNLPPFDSACIAENNQHPMHFIYPTTGTQIILATNVDGEKGLIAKLAHRNPNTTVHWHLDNAYLGSTSPFHEMRIATSKGWHRLRVIDATGQELETRFEIQD